MMKMVELDKKRFAAPQHNNSNSLIKIQRGATAWQFNQ